jgi:nucleotide-binding universal stress UspA family protein
MYSNILIAVDMDQPAPSLERTLADASALARCFSARATLCTVVRDAEAEIQAEWSAIGYREMLELARVRLREIASGLDLPVGVEVGTGTVCGGILEVAERIGADLIVLASHRPGMKDHLIAANAARVARRAACSVLIVRSDDPGAEKMRAAHLATASAEQAASHAAASRLPKRR